MPHLASDTTDTTAAFATPCIRPALPTLCCLHLCMQSTCAPRIRPALPALCSPGATPRRVGTPRDPSTSVMSCMSTYQLLHSAVQHGAVQCSAVQWDAVQLGAAQLGAVEHGTAQEDWVVICRSWPLQPPCPCPSPWVIEHHDRCKRGRLCTQHPQPPWPLLLVCPTCPAPTAAGDTAAGATAAAGAVRLAVLLRLAAM